MLRSVSQEITKHLKMFTDFEPLEIEVDQWESVFSKSLFDKVLDL